MNNDRIIIDERYIDENGRISIGNDHPAYDRIMNGEEIVIQYQTGTALPHVYVNNTGKRNVKLMSRSERVPHLKRAGYLGRRWG